MNKQQIKYYMNQPCVVIREITDEFSEIKINPRYTDAIDGSQWCTECMAGNNGTPTTHVCHQYDEVIEAINDTSAAIIVVVEKTNNTIREEIEIMYGDNGARLTAHIGNTY